ncbi:brain-specific angiogenesis inhibitor 1-associated protein 2 [Elysia marginata]|uniref:Brain-specific angiogenesis inhibitor 1-associated protein 2 n=1 Tax=Elysia marginata TaxID=1093978 RepID=A0AAV4F2I1_9GAST|nr:brain-specific angiogenesis inhibitor 1-associated protein 2 [Elysia marginata]
MFQNLATKFNPQAKILLANGKAYHKALLATSSAARSYIESLGRLGHECRTNGRGGTEELGQAIFRIAEVYKDVQMKFEDCTKALFAEIILPLEQKLDNEFKNAAAEQRKYHQGHKEFAGPHSKAVAALEKFRKKNQSKGMYDEEKEAPVSSN